MKVINARNVNDALIRGIELINIFGLPTDSRNGSTIEIPEPVATVYSHPWERVLFGPVRDANPFFHLMESLWVIAGRQDVKFLNEFNSRMVDYSDDGEVFNAPYGYRMRNTPLNTDYSSYDQIASVIRILKADPNSRQAVLQIWDYHDLNVITKDKPCNISIMFRIREGKLTMTVNNRSNDMIWGAYGANVVQFSMLQEYVAAHLGVPMGEYTQMSNSFHVYTEGPAGDLWHKLNEDYVALESIYKFDVNNRITMEEDNIECFESDLTQFFKIYDSFGSSELIEQLHWKSKYFNLLVMPMFCIHHIHKTVGAREAIPYLSTIESDDWAIAAKLWLNKRVK